MRAFIKNILKGIAKDKIQSLGLGMMIFLSVTLLSTLYNINMGTIKSVDQIEVEGNQQDFMFIATPEQGEKLSKKYKFEYEARNYKNVEDKINGEAYYFKFLNSQGEINTPIIKDGKLPSASNEIAVNTNFAQANEYKVGEEIKINGKNYTLSGIVVIPDYISPVVKENSTVYNHKTEALVITTKDGYESINTKEKLMFSGKFKGNSNEELMKEMKNNEAFSFILFNNENYSINSIEAKISMNKIIVMVSMICLISIVILMLILFLNKKINSDKYSLGVMKAHGFKSIKLALAYIVYPTSILVPSVILGYLSSLILSPSFEKNFNYGFSLPQIEYGFNPIMLSIFIGIPLLSLSYTTIICVLIKLRSKPLELLNDLDNAKMTKSTKFLNKFRRSKNFLSTLKWNFAISNKKLILLCIFGAYCVGLEMILSINLYTMPGKMVEQEFKGRNYSYDIRLIDGASEVIKESDEGYYSTKGTLNSYIREGTLKEVSIDTNIFALNSNGKYLELFDGAEKINSYLDEGFIINEVLMVGQGLKVGDEIIINIDNKEVTGTIKGVNQFLSNNDIYTSPKFLQSKGIKDVKFNGLYTDNDKAIENKSLIVAVTQLDEMKGNFERSTDMVKSAGVLQALIGIVLGCFIIGVTTNVLIQDNRKNLTLMRAMGYSNNEINNACLKVYTPFILLGFLISIPNSFLIMKLMFGEVAKSASMSYPVRFNILAIIISLITTIVVYYATITIYSKKLEKVSLNEVMQ